jgi:hypothetical protein
MRERATNLWLSGEIELTGEKLDLDEIAASGFCALGLRNGVDARAAASGLEVGN